MNNKTKESTTEHILIFGKHQLRLHKSIGDVLIVLQDLVTDVSPPPSYSQQDNDQSQPAGLVFNHQTPDLYPPQSSQQTDTQMSSQIPASFDTSHTSSLIFRTFHVLKEKINTVGPKSLGL